MVQKITLCMWKVGGGGAVYLIGSCTAPEYCSVKERSLVRKSYGRLIVLNITFFILTVYIIFMFLFLHP